MRLVRGRNRFGTYSGATYCNSLHRLRNCARKTAALDFRSSEALNGLITIDTKTWWERCEMKLTLVILLAGFTSLSACASPETTRTRGGEPGADVGNRTKVVEMHEG